MPIIDQPPSSNDASAASKPVDPALDLLMETLYQSREIERTRQENCAQIPLPKVKVDDVAIWFESNVPIQEISGKASLTQADIQMALNDQCQPGESKAVLNLLNDKFDFFSSIDDGLYTEKITNESMEHFGNWMKADKDLLDRLEKVAPEQSAAIKVLHDHFSELDADGNKFLTDNELVAAMRAPDISADKLKELELVDRNFGSLSLEVRLPLSLYSIAVRISEGERGRISATSIENFILQATGDSDLHNNVTFKQGIWAAEEVRLSGSNWGGWFGKPVPEQ
ncbi:hypothetical protein BH11CYA1_BH11CYA1_42750 [soil metagenome]